MIGRVGDAEDIARADAGATTYLPASARISNQNGCGASAGLNHFLLKSKIYLSGLRAAHAKFDKLKEHLASA